MTIEHAFITYNNHAVMQGHYKSSHRYFIVYARTNFYYQIRLFTTSIFLSYRVVRFILIIKYIHSNLLFYVM